MKMNKNEKQAEVMSLIQQLEKYANKGIPDSIINDIIHELEDIAAVLKRYMGEVGV